MATISKRSGGSRGAAGGPPHFTQSKLSAWTIAKLGNEGIEFHALKALGVKEMVSGLWLLSTPFLGRWVLQPNTPFWAEDLQPNTPFSA